MSLVVDRLRKDFGRFAALRDVSLVVAPGEFLALLGPSGSGKTTLLRILAGLETADAGTVTLEGRDFLALTPRARRIGMVFQHYALFRHMTVARNIAFGLSVRPRRERPARPAIAARVEELLRLVQLDGLAGRYPAELSGGQRQRVALARALAIDPSLLLLDEPFGALDAKVRRELRHWLRRVHDETGVTTLFVTHDQEEALDLADRVAVLSGGRLAQVDAPQALWAHPASAFVHDFLGGSLCLAGRVEGDRLHLPGWSTAAPAGSPQGAVAACLRGAATTLSPADSEGLPAVLAALLPRGGRLRAECRLEDGRTLDLDLPTAAPPAGLAPGAPVRLQPQGLHVYPGAPATSAGDS